MAAESTSPTASLQLLEAVAGESGKLPLERAIISYWRELSICLRLSEILSLVSLVPHIAM